MKGLPPCQLCTPGTSMPGSGLLACQSLSEVGLEGTLLFLYCAAAAVDAFKLMGTVGLTFPLDFKCHAGVSLKKYHGNVGLVGGKRALVKLSSLLPLIPFLNLFLTLLHLGHLMASVTTLSKQLPILKKFCLRDPCEMGQSSFPPLNSWKLR